MKMNLRLALLLFSWTVLLTSCERSEPPEPPRALPGPQLALDTSFGVGGIVTTDFRGYEEVVALALQEDGKLVGVGGSRREGTSDDFLLARYLPSGRLDESFGDSGHVFTAAGTADTAPNEGIFTAVALQEDGKILAAGHAVIGTDTDYIGDMVLARYNPDGSLDTSFGDAGLVRAAPELLSDAAALELQADGKIIVAGISLNSGELRLLRYTPTGQLDSSFGVGGIFAMPSRPTAVGEEPELLHATDGDFILAVDTRLIRLNAVGVRDETFGQNGEVDTGYAVQALAQQEDGSIVVGQYSEPNYGALAVQTSEPISTDFRLMRFTLEGELDTGFGEAGVVVTDINRHDTVSELALQSDGKIVAAGTTSADQSAVAVVRYTVQGEVDASFVGAFEGAYALALDDQDRIVVAGYRSGDTSDFALARLLP